jgi:IPT/TIG domain
MISSSGNYTAPSSIPSPNTLTITVSSVASSSATASSAVTLLNPNPVLSGTNPASVGTGSFSLAITGSNFVSGAQVLLGTTPLTTTFVSATQLSATGSESSAGLFSITVVNPDPGSSSSNSVNLQVGASQQASGCSQMSIGQGASLNGFLPFSSVSLWNQDISAAAVDPNSTAIINDIGATIGLHPDFGSGEYQGSNIGIPYTVAGLQQPNIPINFTAYGSESDPGPMPVAVTDPIEGYPNPGSGDRHVLVLDNANCFLYELYSSYPQTSSWNAASAAVWDLLGNEQRPYTWTSADAAGLPIFPGLVRYDEVAAGVITHAIRFTLQNSRAAFVAPASHWAATTSDPLAAPMGMRLRLKASFDVSGFSATNQVILNAFKKYGVIMADNGSSMYISGAPDDRWDNSDLHNLGQVQASDFEVMEMSPIYTQANVPTGASPNVTSFATSAATVAAGTSVTLSWQVTGASYIIVSPQIGAVRGSSVSVTPTATTTYTLYATNGFGQTTATVTVTVQ